MKLGKHTLITFEFYSLLLLAICLPLIEGPKNIACLIYLALFTTRAIKYKIDFRQHNFGKYLMIYIVGSFIAAIGAALNDYDTNKISDIFRYSIIGWMLLYTPLSKQRIYIIFSALALSALTGVVYGYYALAQGYEPTFKIHSVGHINHTSIYILLVMSLILAFLFKRPFRPLYTVGIIILLTIFFTALIDTRSRATFIGLAVISLVFLGIFVLQNKRRIYWALSISFITIAGLCLYPPAVLKDFLSIEQRLASGQLTPRERIWNVALLAWKKEPVFGVGFGNYKVVNKDKLQQWYGDDDKDFSDNSQYLYFTHTHNRYMNTLVEGGLVGFISLLAMLLGLTAYLFQTRGLALEAQSSPYWLACAGTLLTIILVGVFNTTLHHEHGILSMLIIGITLNQLNAKKSADAKQAS